MKTRSDTFKKLPFMGMTWWERLLCRFVPMQFLINAEPTGVTIIYYKRIGKRTFILAEEFIAVFQQFPAYKADRIDSAWFLGPDYIKQLDTLGEHEAAQRIRKLSLE